MAETKCPLCKSIINTKTCRDCADAIFPHFQNTMKKKTNKLSPFQQVDNLVFQGGGIKGIAFLGVLQALQERNKSLLPQVKRIAGTSAGALVALYLGLNKDLAQIEKILKDNDYSALLDNGPEMSVEKVGDKGGIKVKAKDIILRLSEYAAELRELADKGQIDFLKVLSIFSNIMAYILTKTGYKWMIETFLGGLLDKLVKWLTGIFVPPSRDKNKDKEKVKQYQVLCKTAKEEAMSNIAAMREQLAKEGVLGKEDETPKSKVSKSALEDEQTFLYAFTELIYSSLMGKKDDEAQKTAAGLFTADNFKEALILKPIRDSLENIKTEENKYKAEEITFAELASLRKPDGELAFRPFYVTAFDSASFRTEIFSAEHTPHVIVADAVRASMSIPLFFKSVEIYEKPPGQEKQARKAWTMAGESFNIFYMDGGILDNYPIWIFDDLKYCTKGTTSAWTPEQKVAFHNPNTLGVRVLDIDRIFLYEEPYKDDTGKWLPRKSYDVVETGTHLAVIKLLLNVEFNEHEENSYAHAGDYYRSIYVYNCGIGPASLRIETKEKTDLISSGHLAVEFFEKRALKSFGGEIGTLFPTSCPTNCQNEVK